MELVEVGATLRSYVGGSGALEAVVAVEGALLTCDARGAVTVQRADAPEDAEPERLAVTGAQPAPLGMELKRLPPFAVDATTAEINAPLGGLEHVAEGVMALAVAVGAPAVALAWFATLDEETPFALSAREGEGLVIVIGDEHFEMGEGWPPRRPAP